MEKTLPHNIEAEQGVLGSLVLDPMALTLVADFLRAEDFYRDAHRSIYETVLRLTERGEVADFITICDELERRNKLDDVGGASYITSLINAVPTSGNVEYYGRIVERTGILRRLIYASGQIAARAYEGDADAAETLSFAQGVMFEIASRSQRDEPATIADLAYDYIGQIAELRKRPRGSIVGVPTGFRKLDFLTGGLQKGDLMLLAGRPGTGKTSFMLAVALHAAQASKRVLLFSLEMSKEALMQRLVAMLASVDTHRLRVGWLTPEEWTRVEAKTLELAALEDRLLIDDRQGLTPLEVRSRALIQRERAGLDMICIDYVQRMEATINGKRISDRYQEVSEISNKTKALAVELALPVLALAQLNRKPEERADKRPQLSDLEQSGKLEQDSDIVGFLYREDYYDKESAAKGIAELILAKHRNGPTDTVRLRFDAAYTRFRDLVEVTP